MSKDNILKPIQPGNVDDQLTEILRNGARALLAQAVEAEVADFLGKHADLKTGDRRQRVVRHGHLPERERTTNPIESTFATVRHRTIWSKGCLSNRTALAMVFKLLEGAQKSWRRLDGHNQLPKLVLGVTFNDGIEVIAKPTDRQPITAAA
ncbi:hypothetical protein [Bradyrhizobium sp. WD16]|uniref:hypothetical protein n=1 Tax=Bradyrhizobium sp. WD16 TaxID=1521768 RepID=UPI0020A2CC00|nr:hypothetical protein [Bradyrhizobium sp. WD16]UTD27770.1 hypothetical protein DB459_13455 [Bradyrhizobium sp. WD16]